MALSAEPHDGVAVPIPALLLREAARGVELAVHDASRLAWNVTIPLPARGRATYSFELELEVPTNIAGPPDPWSALQSYGRLDDVDARGGRSPEAFRRGVVGASSRIARARDGFVRHCTILQSSHAMEENLRQPLLFWLEVISKELSVARTGVLTLAPRGADRALADEFLSLQQWTALTDCARALFDVRKALAERSHRNLSLLDDVERALADGLESEIAYRKHARFPFAEPANRLQLERLLSRRRWLKKHFERVLFLDVDSYEVVRRFSSWFSAFMAVLAYLWFLVWQLALERRAPIGSGVVALALLTSVAYASRERLKEAGRNWLSGRVQRLFAQRVTHYRLPHGKSKPRGALVVTARESFSQSNATRPDPDLSIPSSARDVTLLRLMHRGEVVRPPGSIGKHADKVRLIYRFDLSALFPRLHDAVSGFATVDDRTGGIVVLDVPRNYELPIRARIKGSGLDETVAYVLVLNKNGLVRLEERNP